MASIKELFIVSMEKIVNHFTNSVYNKVRLKTLGLLSLLYVKYGAYMKKMEW